MIDLEAIRNKWRVRWTRAANEAGFVLNATNERATCSAQYLRTIMDAAEDIDALIAEVERLRGTGAAKNAEALADFMAYCRQSPSQRFWQALRNWSGAHFIYASFEFSARTDLLDTFYVDGGRLPCERKEDVTLAVDGDGGAGKP